MDMLQLKLGARAFALWAAFVGFAAACSLFKAYHQPDESHGIVGFINLQWKLGYRILPRSYMIAIAIICLVGGIGALVVVFLPNPSTRPPFFH